MLKMLSVYEPAADGACASCRCLPLQKAADDYSTTSATPHSNQRRFRHSSSSNNTSPVAEPAYKIRRQTINSNELVSNEKHAQEDPETSHIDIEPKIDYDCISNEDEPLNEPAAVAIATTSSTVVAAAFRGDAPSPELHFERMQMQHEFFIQQQQQQHHHQQQQQQQLQQHMEVLMQERPSGGNTLRQRKERMSRKQKEIYVTYLEQTPIMTEYKRNDPVLDVYWQKLTAILNSVPQGAIKSMNEWKQAFDNWRFRIYLYARFNSKVAGDAVLNPKNFKPLTMTDKRAYSLWVRNPDTAPPDLEKMRNIFVNLDETQQE